MLNFVTIASTVGRNSDSVVAVVENLASYEIVEESVLLAADFVETTCSDHNSFELGARLGVGVAGVP